MPTEIYHLGSTSAAIKLSVAVSTPGIADTDPALITGEGLTYLPCISGPTGNFYDIRISAQRQGFRKLHRTQDCPY